MQTAAKVWTCSSEAGTSAGSALSSRDCRIPRALRRAKSVRRFQQRSTGYGGKSACIESQRGRSGSIRAAFYRAPGIGRNGYVRRNSFRGPDLIIWISPLAKCFTVAEGKTLEFKWETYNAVNHVNLANPNSDIQGNDPRSDHFCRSDAPDAVWFALPLLVLKPAGQSCPAGLVFFCCCS